MEVIIVSVPVPEHLVFDGGAYWASWGNKGWSAVTILEVKRTKAIARRVNPKTNIALPTNATVRVDELVKRNVTLKGNDKPQKSPAIVFASVRNARASK
jgi:hypothetical protein